MKKHIYFVSYQFQDGIITGFGNIEIISNEKFKNYEQLTETMKVIKEISKKRHNNSESFQACILNFILLRTEKKRGAK